jgi:glycosyltransferase involved in cell wall biosynthesis
MPKLNLKSDTSKKRLKILACPANEGGCAYYRIILPAKKLAELHSDECEIRIDMNPLGWDKKAMDEAKDGKKKILSDYTAENLEWADVVWHQNIHNFGGGYTFELMRKTVESNKLAHYDNDDLLTDLYTGHRLYSAYVDNNFSDMTKEMYSFVDIVSVTQRKFAERVAPYCGRALVIIKNAIDYNLPCWNMPKLPAPRKGKTCRVGWVGGIHHEEDVKEFPGVSMAVNSRVGPENVHWGWYGRPPMPMKDGKPNPDWQQDVWKNYEKYMSKGIRHRNYQIYGAAGPEDYGKMYTNIDVAIAPLQMNNFNDSKSEIKVAECGRYGIPLIASNVGCYDETIKNGVTGYLTDPSNPKKEWVKYLSRCVKDPKHYREMGQNLKKITDEHFDINKNVHGRLDLYREILKAKQDAAQKNE